MRRRCGGWEDVKMRRCEDEKVWIWEGVLQTPTIGRTLRSDALGNRRTILQKTRNTLGSKCSISMSFSKRRALCHSRRFSHALIAALYVISVGWRFLASSSVNKFKACCHSAAFSHALMAAFCEIMSASKRQLSIQLNTKIAICHSSIPQLFPEHSTLHCRW